MKLNTFMKSGNKKVKAHGLSIDDLDMLWIGSFRYYLGRMTISTHSYCDSLMCNWGTVPERAKVVIMRDLDEEIKRDDADRERGSEHKALGHDCDSQKWREVWKLVSA
jgi:hypothetical protein